MTDLDERTGAELRHHFEAMTGRLSVDGAVAARVVAGGQARLVARRRRRLAGMAAVTVAATAAWLVPGNLGADHLLGRKDGPAVSTPAVPPPWLEPYLDGPVRGDLADDVGYQEAVLSAWSKALHTPESQDNWNVGIWAGYKRAAGTARVAWAQTSPAGPAALVVQRVITGDFNSLPEDGGGLDDLTDKELWVAGLIGVDTAGKPRVAGVAYEGVRRSAWYVDPGHHTLAVLDLGEPLRWTLGFDYSGSQIRTRPEHDVDLSRGWAFLDVPSGADPWAVQVIAGDRQNDLATENVPYLHDSGHTEGDPIQSPIAGMARVAYTSIIPFANKVREFEVQGGAANEGPSSGPVWALGRLRNGNPVVVFTAQFGLARPQLYLGEQTPDGIVRHHVGPVPLKYEDPLIAPLPDGSGAVWVSIPGTVRYRAADGTWSAPAPNALFVPKDAITAEAVRSDAVVGSAAGDGSED